LIIKSAEFVTSAVKPSQYPPAVLPEIAFAGRSNVGKSSLINTLVNRKRLVKTSSTPGRTQLINFFNINEVFSFVDIPGYGYAKVPASVKKKWGPMIETYITTRNTLKGVVLIMDGVPSVPVLTKSDKLSKTRQQKQLKEIANTLSANKDNFILFSAKSRQGKNEVWGAVKELIL